MTESWANEKIEDAEISFSGFTLFRQHRSSCSNKKGGGVLLFIKDYISAVSVNDEVIGNNESVWVKVKNGKND